MSLQTNIGSEAAAPDDAIARTTSRLAQSARQVMATILLRRAIRKAEAALMALSDRSLKDIGLSRSEIQSAVREVFGVDRADTRAFLKSLS